MPGDSVCLLVQRAGITREFRLRGNTIRFGYAPGGENDLVLHDSLLDDVQGIIEYHDGVPDDEFTAYRLRAKSAGIEVENVSLPPREAVSIRLKIGQRIKVGRHYQLTIATYATSAGNVPDSISRALDRVGRSYDRSIPLELQQYMEVSRLFLRYLPEIYRSDEVAGADARSFLARYLALFESVYLPLQWTVQSFALYLQPGSAPPEWLPWLADWYGFPARIDFLSEETQRSLLARMHDLLERKGTVAGLTDLLNALVGAPPIIVDTEEANSFSVTIETKPEWWRQYREDVIKVIDWYKPAHTSFTLK
jgi:phage tail-like protein